MFIWMLAALTVLPNKTFKFPSMLVIGLYPFGFLMLVLSVRERLTSSHPDASYLGYYLPTKPPSSPHLQQVQHASCHGQVRRAHELNANKKEIHLIEVKYCEDTRPGHQL